MSVRIDRPMKRLLCLTALLLPAPGLAQSAFFRPGSVRGDVGVAVLVAYVNVAGDAITVSVAVFSGDDPVVGADVEVRVATAAGDGRKASAARDEGNAKDGDAEADDGLYSTRLEGVSTGVHALVATAVLPDGSTLGAFEFFEVFGRTGRLDGSWSDRGVDANGDGFLDAIELTFGVEIEREGHYGAMALLRARDGSETWTRNGGAYLDTKSTTIRAELTAEDVEERLGVDGPYEVVSARLLWAPRTTFGVERTHIASERTDLGETHAYDLESLERPYVVFTRYLGDEGVDEDGDGRFERIRVRFEIESVMEGRHPFAFNARLVPEVGPPEEVEPRFVLGEATVGPGRNALTLTFPVEAYAAAGVGGSFVVTDASVFPLHRLPSPYGEASGAYFRMPSVLGTTRAYALEELEGARSASP